MYSLNSHSFKQNLAIPITPISTSRTSESDEPPGLTPGRRRIISLIVRLHSHFKKSMATGTSAATVANMTCSLHKLPVELWEEIFKPLCVDWNGRMPNLIKALRPDRKLYNEALAIFYKHNMFILHRENGWSFGDMTKEAVLSFKKIKVLVESNIMKEGLWKVGGPKKEDSMLTPVPSASLFDASNIREVTVKFLEDHTFKGFPPFIQYGGVSYSLNYFLVSFQKLRRVDLILPKQPMVGWGLFVEIPAEAGGDGIRMINTRLGTPAKLSRVLALHLDDSDWTEETRQALLPVSIDEWFWQAEEGSFLKAPPSKTSKPPSYDSLPSLSRLSMN